MLRGRVGLIFPREGYKSCEGAMLSQTGIATPHGWKAVAAWK